MNTFESYYTWPVDAAGTFLRYFLFAGVTYFIFHVWKKRNFQSLKIQPAPTATAAVQREILFSTMTLFIYCAASWIIFYFREKGYTTIYSDIEEYGLFYFFFSIFLMVMLHDAYFYWTHRFLHLPGIYRLVHQTHHQAVNPTPWSAFAFHPLEACIAVGIIPLIVFVFPCHPAALLIFLTYMTLINVMGHLGYETFPLRFRQSQLGKWHNTSTNHNLHHEVGRGNYGLYFTLWDRLMATYQEKNLSTTSIHMDQITFTNHHAFSQPKTKSI